MDLANAAGNTSDGVHIASAAGVWQALVFGFGGVREYDGELSITPHLPPRWDSLTYSCAFAGADSGSRSRMRRRPTRSTRAIPSSSHIRGERHLLTIQAPLRLAAVPERPLASVVGSPVVAPG